MNVAKLIVDAQIITESIPTVNQLCRKTLNQMIKIELIDAEKIMMKLTVN